MYVCTSSLYVHAYIHISMATLRQAAMMIMIDHDDDDECCRTLSFLIELVDCTVFILRVVCGYFFNSEFLTIVCFHTYNLYAICYGVVILNVGFMAWLGLGR